MQFETLQNPNAMEQFRVKKEFIEPIINNNDNVNATKRKSVSSIPVIDLDSSDDDSSGSGTGKYSRVLNNKKMKSFKDVVLPDGFLDPLPTKKDGTRAATRVVNGSCKQFWKAGDFDQSSGGTWETLPGGMDHVRVHPRFLHSNATSHKWVLGAFAELLDNSLDEVCNGATYVSIDMLKNKKDGNRMLVIEDNGGGMDPNKLRQCMSLGYSLKSKVANTIGQYGNGFKTSTMRLGADVIVFSRCSAKDGKRSTQSIGLLSYTFLRSTGKEDIVVPMIDYERNGWELKKIMRSSPGDWDKNIEAVVQWSPFSSEADLLRQFDHMQDQGTRIIIYNMWEDDQGQLELDFDADENDIQIRGVNRDEKNIQMARDFPNSRHFLTYRHSMRSYASILYLRIPPGFRMILRGKDVEHHNIVNDMMMTTEVTYRPQPGTEGLTKDSNIVAVVTMGFVKDAKSHIDVQGYNVYHKNRLIKPFWRLWNASGSDGRGVIGVLEANFVEPAHDKQGFERTIVLSRLESRLLQMQKTYWRTYCHKIGYAPRVNKNHLDDRESFPDYSPQTTKKKAASTLPDHVSNKFFPVPPGQHFEAEQDYSPYGNTTDLFRGSQSQFLDVGENGSGAISCSTADLNKLMEENRQLKEKLNRKDGDILGNVLHELESERKRCWELEAELEEVKKKCKSLNQEQESIIDIFAEEREKREAEEATLRKKLKQATATIQDLVERVKQLELEKMKTQNWSAG